MNEAGAAVARGYVWATDAEADQAGVTEVRTSSGRVRLPCPLAGAAGSTVWRRGGRLIQPGQRSTVDRAGRLTLTGEQPTHTRGAPPWTRPDG